MPAMTMTASAPRWLIIVLWVLRLLMAGLFLFAAFSKLSGQPMMVAEFGTIGLGQGFRYITGLIELLGAIALLVPRVSLFGAVALLFVDIGAFIAQVTILHADWIHTVVIGLILCVVIYLQRDRFMSGVRRV